MKKNILILFLLVQAFSVSSQLWIPDTNNKFNIVYTGLGAYGTCLLSVNDTLFLGGHFNMVSNTNAFNILKYSNGNWFSLKGGLDDSPNSLLYNQNDGYLYVSGVFLQADNKPGTMGLARWDGNNWWPIGTNSNCGSCYGTMEYYDNKVFFSGNNMLGMAFGVIAWDGTNWVSKCNLPPIKLLKGYANDLLAGNSAIGAFLKYEGDTNWSSQPYGGMNGGPYRAEKDTVNDFLYLAGGFFSVNVNNAPILSVNIAMYDGFEWHSMGINTPAVWSMKMYHGYLYAGIDSILNDSTEVNYIGRWEWNDNQWHSLGSGLDNWANAMEEFHDTLFVTGGFTTAGGDSAYGLARWYMPDTGCHYLQPIIHTLNLQDTFYISQGHADVQFFNNNAYVQAWQWDFGDSGTANTQNPVHSYTNDSTYTITVTVTDNGCIKTDTAHIVVLWGTPVEMYTKENLNFKVYPNPTSGDFTIECTLPQNKTGKVKAFRNTGSELGEHPLESGCNSFVMPSSNWKDSIILVGVYIDGKQVLVEKVVKN